MDDIGLGGGYCRARSYRLKRFNSAEFVLEDEPSQPHRMSGVCGSVCT